MFLRRGPIGVLQAAIHWDVYRDLWIPQLVRVSHASFVWIQTHTAALNLVLILFLL